MAKHAHVGQSQPPQDLRLHFVHRHDALTEMGVCQLTPGRILLVEGMCILMQGMTLSVAAGGYRFRIEHDTSATQNVNTTTLEDRPYSIEIVGSSNPNCIEIRA